METNSVELNHKFWPFVNKREDTCWEWTGGKDTDGYGRLSYRGRRHQAHKLSFMIHKGEIPSKLIVLRTCKNRLCVNPDHLVLGTQSDNASGDPPKEMDYIVLSEKGKIVFHFVDLEDKPVKKMLSEIMAMEIRRGAPNMNKSRAMRNAVAFYHATLKRSLAEE